MAGLYIADYFARKSAISQYFIYSFELFLGYVLTKSGGHSLAVGIKCPFFNFEFAGFSQSEQIDIGFGTFFNSTKCPALKGDFTTRNRNCTDFGVIECFIAKLNRTIPCLLLTSRLKIL